MIVPLSASILLLMILPARAQSPAKDTQSVPISDARMRSVLAGMALDFTEAPGGDATVFAIRLDGHRVALRNRAEGLSLSACFAGGIEPIQANQWNREHFSTRAFLDEKGCVSLGAEVRFGGRPTIPMIQDFVRGFCTDVAVFARFLARPAAAPDSPAAAVLSLDRLASPIGAMAWTQLGPFAKRTPPAAAAVGSVPGLLKIHPDVALKYDPAQWTPAPPRGDGQFAFSHASGAAHALVVSEPVAVPLDSVADVVLANAQSVDPHARVVFRHRRWANGVAWWFLKVEAAVETTPMVYWGYFYAGEGRTVQVVAYTETSRLPEYGQAFTDFLNGLTVSR